MPPHLCIDREHDLRLRSRERLAQANESGKIPNAIRLAGMFQRCKLAARIDQLLWSLRQSRASEEDRSGGDRKAHYYLTGTRSATAGCRAKHAGHILPWGRCLHRLVRPIPAMPNVAWAETRCRAYSVFVLPAQNRRLDTPARQ